MGFADLEEEGVVDLSEDHHVTLGVEAELLPDSIPSFVDQVAHGGLRFVSDRLAEGRVVVGPAEESPLTADKGGDGLCRGELSLDPLPPALEGERSLERSLEILDQLRRDFQVPRHCEGLAII